MSSSTCLRSKLYTPFSENNVKVPPLQPLHQCCSVCSLNCLCGMNDCIKVYEFEKPDSLIESSPLQPTFCRQVTEADIKNVYHLLEAFHNSCCTLFSVPSGLSSGLTQSILLEIVENLSFINSAEYIVNHFVPDECLASNIFQVIEDYFNKSSPVKNEKATDENLMDLEQEIYEFSDFSDNDSEIDYFDNVDHEFE